MQLLCTFSKLVITVCLLLNLQGCSSQADANDQFIKINDDFNNFVESYDNIQPFANSVTEFPMAEAFITKHGEHDTIHIDNATGIQKWISNETVISVFFYAAEKTLFDLSIRAQLAGATDTLRLQLQNVSTDVVVSGNVLSDYKVGQFSVESSGYYRVDLTGLAKNAPRFAGVTHLIFDENQGTAAIQKINGLHTTRSDLYYQGYPGKSEYFYQEFKVPKDFDPKPTYFCISSFTHGYFGFQRNANVPSRILFAIWSPQNTSNPAEVTEDNKVKLISKGKDVVDNEFGHEGAGHHAFLSHDWKTDTTYRLLVRGTPLITNNSFSVYTAWWAEEQEDWNLLATLLRPKSNGSYLSSWSSFIEDYSGRTAYLPRKLHVGNQWAISSNGEWKEVTKAQLLYKIFDEPRIGFDVGAKQVDGSEFFEMTWGGFEKGNVTNRQIILRQATGKKPNITDLP